MFFRKPKPTANPWQSFADIHTHLLPGVDDGVRSAAESVEILSLLHTKGVKRVYLTPHVMDDYPQNRAAYLKKQFQHLLRHTCGAAIPELHLAAEYMLDGQFGGHIEEGLLSYDGRHVLVEMSCVQAPNDLHEKLYEMQLSSYTPILAHPERYLFLSLPKLERLKECGCQFQLNLFSLCGMYGAEVAKQAEQLLRKGMYDYAGSDLHSAAYLEFYAPLALRMEKDRQLTAVVHATLALLI